MPLKDAESIKIRNALGLIDSSNPLPVDVQDISAGTQTNDVKVTLDGEDVTTIPGPIQGRPFPYKDTSFVTGDSPIVLDVNTDLGRNSVDGNIINDGPGNILVEISNDGSNFSPQITLTDCDEFDLRNVDVDKIRLTWVSDSSYRVTVI